MDKNNIKTLWTAEEVAKRLRVNPVTIRTAIAKGNLSAFRAGGQYRIEFADLEKFIGADRAASLFAERKQ